MRCVPFALTTLLLACACRPSASSASSPTQEAPGTAAAAPAWNAGFGEMELGTPTKSWQSAGGSWHVVEDASAPSHARTLEMSKHEGGAFNLCFAPSAKFKEGNLRVAFKAISGEEDQGGGPIWRVKDADNYWICRVNPLEDNFRLYKVVNGSRIELDSAEVKVKAGEWHAITVSHHGTKVACSLDGKELLHADDAALPDAGGVGVWSKSDAMTRFDGLEITGDAVPVLTPRQTIALPKVGGRIDHMCLSPDGKRLYIAALGNDSVEVVDLERGVHVASIPGVHEVQGVAWLPESGRLAAASGHDNECRFYDADLKQTGAIAGLEDADNMRRDAGAGLLYVGHGSGALALVDAAKCQKLADIPLAGHPEAFEVEANGSHVFVNVPGARQIAVVDKAKRAVVATWPLDDVRSNFPMALDETKHRLFVGCRHPAKMLVIDTESGRRVASLDCCGDADDIFVDQARNRVYLTGGDGAISVFAREGADKYTLAATLPTASGARTSLFDPTSGRLFVAVPHRFSRQAEIRVFSAGEASGSTLALDLGKPVCGPKVEPADLKKPMLVQYWGDQCPPCHGTIPHLCELQKEYGREKLIVIANQVWDASEADTKGAWEEFAPKDYAVSVINHGSVNGVQIKRVPHSVPYAFVFDKEGKLVWRGRPTEKGVEELDKAVKKAVGE